MLQKFLVKSIYLFCILLFSSVFLALAAEKVSDDFVWGVSNSSFQVEGSPAPSDWSSWTHTKGKISDASTADQATDFWNRYEEDLILAEQLGAKAFRISIAWERIEPLEGTWDRAALEKYREILLAVRAHGMEPYVTLSHWTLPTWVAKKGGYVWQRFPEVFATYAETVVATFSVAPTSVKWWMTLNEPIVVLTMGYMDGRFPPGHVGDMDGFNRGRFNSAKAHLLALQRIRRLVGGNELKIGIADHLRDFQPNPKFKRNLGINSLLTSFARQKFNDDFLDAIITGHLNFSMSALSVVPSLKGLPFGDSLREKIDMKDTKGIDFLGINYYGRYLVGLKFKNPPLDISEGTEGPRTDLGWEVYPEGLYNISKWAWNRYHLPILVSENGLADSTDKLRGQFIRDHVRQIAKLRNDGVNVFGYFYWSLTDNFEWSDGLSPRFGLVDIDYAHNLQRTPRKSYFQFQKLISDGIPKL